MVQSHYLTFLLSVFRPDCIMRRKQFHLTTYHLGVSQEVVKLCQKLMMFIPCCLSCVPPAAEMLNLTILVLIVLLPQTAGIQTLIRAQPSGDSWLSRITSEITNSLHIIKEKFSFVNCYYDKVRSIPTSYKYSSRAKKFRTLTCTKMGPL